MIKVLSIDPGGTTGLAWCDVEPDNEAAVYLDQAKLSAYELYQVIYESQPHHIICETFEFRRKTRDNLVLESRNLIGIAQLYCEMSQDDGPMLWKPEGGIGKCRLHMQTAAQGKGYWSDDALKRNNLYDAGKHHARDAERHLLQWLYFGYGFQFGVVDRVTLSTMRD